MANQSFNYAYLFVSTIKSRYVPCVLSLSKYPSFIKYQICKLTYCASKKRNIVKHSESHAILFRKCEMKLFQPLQQSLKTVPFGPCFLNQIDKFSNIAGSLYLHTSSTSSLKDEEKIVCDEADSAVNTVEEVLTKYTDKLKDYEIPEAELQVEYIISHILGINRVQMENEKQLPLSKSNMERFKVMIDCRLARMPLQYIIGDWDFHSVTIKVRPPVFIPRTETESLVEIALKAIEGLVIEKRPIKVFDVCCGSGAIAMSLLKNNANIICTALDKCEFAINLTRENADDLGFAERIVVIHGKVEQILETLGNEKFDLIVTNPPYVPRIDTLVLQKEILLYEDMQAIDGGDEGLEIIKPLLKNCQFLLTERGIILMEIDPPQVVLLSQWLHQNKQVKLKVVDVYKDLFGKERFVKFMKS